MKLAQRLERFPEYIFSRLAKATAEVEKQSGRKVLDFGAGSPDITPSAIYLEKLNEFAHDARSHLYPGYKGISEFNEAIKGWYKRRFDVELDDDEILPLLGAKDGVSHLPLALLNEGDEILVPNPGYPGFTGPALMLGAHPIPYDLSKANGFKLSAQSIANKISSKTKAIWMNFPSNPTGAVATVDELRETVEISKKHGAAIVYDNAYVEITFDGFKAPSILQIDGAKETAVELGSFSKTFSFAGLRMGWIVGNREMIAALAKVKSQMDSGMWLPLQRLGAFALTNTDEAWKEQMLATYKKRRDIIAEKLRTLGLTFEVPQGALYIWAKIPDSAKDSESFSMQLLKEKQVLLTPGSAYGTNGERYVRVSICVNVDAINEYL